MSDELHSKVAVPRRKRRWLKITGICVGVLVVLLLLFPTLLSWMGKGLILGQVNKRIQGRIEADSLSLGWFSGAKVYGAKLLGPDGQVVASVPAVTTGLTVLGALGSAIDLGNTHADVDSLALQVYDDGSSNLDRALAPRQPVAAEPNAAKTLLAGDIQCGVKSLTVERVGNPTIVASNTALRIKLDTAGNSPLVMTLASTLKVGDAAATPISAEANVALFARGSVREIGQITGTAKGDLGTQDAALLAPLLAKQGIKLQPGGTVKASFTFSAPTAGSGVIEAPLVINATAFTDKGDTVPLHNARASFKGNIVGNTLTLAEGTGITSEFLTLATKGSVSSEAIDVTGTLDYSLDRIAQLGQRYMPEGAKVTGQHQTSFHLHGKPSLTGLVLDAKNDTALVFDQVSIPGQGIDARSGKLGVSMSGGKLTVSSTDISANNGKVNIVGYVDLGAEKPAFIVPKPLQLAVNVQINKPMGDKMLVWLPATWGLGDQAAATVTGQLTLKIDSCNAPLNFQEFLKSGYIKGSLTLTNFATESPLFSRMSSMLGPLARIAPGDLGVRAGTIPEVSFEIKNGKAHYENLTISLAVLTVTFSGDVGLDFSAERGAPIDMMVSLRHRSFPAPFAFRLTGTTKKYELKLDEKTLQQTIQNVSPNMLEGVLKGINKKY